MTSSLVLDLANLGMPIEQSEFLERTMAGVVSVGTYSKTAGDGVTDSTKAIQKSIDKISSSGGVLYFPAGTYKTTGLINIPSYVKVRGSGRYATRILVSHATNDIFTSSNSALVEISDLDFYSNVTRTGGAAISLLSVNQFSIERCRFVATYQGINIVTCNDFTLRDLLFVDGATGGWDRAVLFDDCVGGFIERTTAIYGDRIPNSACFEIQSDCDTLVFNGCGAGGASGTGNSICWKIANTTLTGGGVAPRWLKFVHCEAEGGTGIANRENGWQFDAGTSIQLVDCYAATSKNGIQINSSVNGLQVIGGEFFSNSEHGIEIAGGSSIKIDGADIHNNSQSAAGSFDGISISAGSQIRLLNNSFGSVSGYGNTCAHRNEIRLSGSSDNIIINGNNLNSSSTAINDGTSGGDVILTNNTPSTWNREMAKINTFANNATTPSVAYGTCFQTAPNSAPTSITYFNGGRRGQVIEVRIDANTTIVHDTANIRCKSGANIVGTSTNNIVRFRNIADIWFEIPSI